MASMEAEKLHLFFAMAVRCQACAARCSCPVQVFVACLRSFRREGKVTQRARSGPDVLEVDKLTRITSSALKHLKKTDSRGVEDDEVLVLALNL